MKEIWIIGFLLNLFLLYAVFQIYFQSPVVQIDHTFSSRISYPIKRVVFFVGDGLRADTFYKNPNNHPYLMSLLGLNHSAWGISHTRVPTESRPGHIALFAGIYEDPSAIFTGWKKNLVEFDSIFNRTQQSIALGSPDIVDMFGQGAGKEKIYYESYPPSWQDFLKTDSSLLDTWVLDRFKRIVNQQKLPQTDKSLIFLHFLGIDNTGHAQKPYSRKYLDSISLVDTIVPQIEQLVNSYYKDNQTLFIFTSDHGMTDWGSHGAGSIEETTVPFIVWGNEFILKTTEQYHLKQADFCALVAGALSVPYPTNSVGRFPVEIWEKTKHNYEALVANFRQIRELLIAKKSLVNHGILPFVVYSKEQSTEALFDESINAFNKGRYIEAIESLNQGIEPLLEGVLYYERYNQLLMKSFVIIVFILWIVVIVGSVLGILENLNSMTVQNFTASLVSSLFLTTFVFGWTFWRIPYILVPILLIHSILNARIRLHQRKWNLKHIMVFILMVVFSETLVFTFYQRKIVSIALISTWIWCLPAKIQFYERILWLVSLGLKATFPFLPIIGGTPNTTVVSIGSTVYVIFGLLILSRLKNPVMGTISDRERLIILVQILLQVMSMILIHFPEMIITRIFSWMSVLGLVIPVILHSNYVILQLLSIFLATGTTFTYLSLGYEVFFLPSLLIVLVILIKFETYETGNWADFWYEKIEGTHNNVEHKDILTSCRLASIHLVFIYGSFFGIGNIASISSFDPIASRCFLSIFNPFAMMGLLLIKILIPFLLVSSTMYLIMSKWSYSKLEQNFLIVLGLCQGIALHMFLNVTNIGSWLEIGTSISHYVIVQVTTLFLFILFFISNFLVGMNRIFLFSDISHNDERKVH